ncbi:Epidermal growth factor receptor substrate 15-like [Gracilariopsis chorda]|uniref:Epidermal growth factor receptor substrate 15-like n=1 Tax=Gracilariopsis chorda TaxID=448386 RepID=A0A2V3J1N3_9FLOR|nr:Epidermal growth factor receptor substrate 15-like [Gracilariopsis chorda]|eukprot:PXF48341.1 Epidermal growth factor receptor substrate 15-like [Gracilariopsis chorda]
MNFGGGPNGNGFQNPNFGAFSQASQMPFPGMPVFPMPSVHPAMQGMHQGMLPQMPNAYPPGQGPLANRPVGRGANGLYQAPEPEGPEEHPAKQHMMLNPGEVTKYMEYWSQACDGAETISGSEAVQFLSRAAKVSKGQLRKIWDIADHRKEGKLDQDQFFIALRLIALAQRGAALSESGLRNFRGIQLIPQITPPKKEPQPTANAPAMPLTQQQTPTFSWTVPKQVVERYDTFFHGLDGRKLGMIDGTQGVAFFGKSGLPRSTLKVIWQLADITRDGKLSRDEFRAAMHMVASIRNKRITVDALPSSLDPSGPNWLRVEGEHLQQATMATHEQQQTPTLQPHATHSQVSPTPHVPPIPKLSPTGHGSRRPSHRRQPSSSGSRTPGRVAPPPAAMSPQKPLVPPPPPPSAISPRKPLAPPPPPPVQRTGDDHDQMREALERERMDHERAKLEMEKMKAEMEKLRLEKEKLTKRTTSGHHHRPSHSRKGSSSSIPLSSQGSGYGSHRQPASAHPAPDLVRGTGSKPHAPPPVVLSPQKPSSISKNSPAPRAKKQDSTPMSPIQPLKGPDRKKPIDLGLDDDDIWDQPSPKASVLPSPSKLTQNVNPAQSKDSVSSDDDDDDFWGL